MVGFGKILFKLILIKNTAQNTIMTKKNIFHNIKIFWGLDLKKAIAEFSISTIEYFFVPGLIQNKVLWIFNTRFAQKVILGRNLRKQLSNSQLRSLNTLVYRVSNILGTALFFWLVLFFFFEDFFYDFLFSFGKPLRDFC